MSEKVFCSMLEIGVCDRDPQRLLTRGPFMCTPDHAVDMAYFVSQLELAAERGMDAHDLGDILHRYAGNRTSVDEALVELQEFIDEHKETAND